MLNSPQSWSASVLDANQYIVMDAGSPVRIHGVATQGRADWWQWVSQYDISVSSDNQTFTYVNNFVGNSDRFTVVYNFFDDVVEGRWVKINPTTWNDDDDTGYMSMRCAIIVEYSPPSPPLPLCHRAILCAFVQTTKICQ